MIYTPTQDFLPNLAEELNYWGARVTERIRSNFDRLGINKTPGGEFTGDLYRSIWWTVHTASGGSEALIEFYFLHYAGYVQTGTGAGAPRFNVPQMNTMEAIARPDGQRRKAKPFLRSEIRLHLRWLADRLFHEYRFGGSFYIVKGIAEGMGDPSITQQWVADHADELSQGLRNHINSR